MVSFSDVCAEKRKYIARKIDGSLDLGGGGGAVEGCSSLAPTPMKVVTDKKSTKVFDHFMYTFPFYFSHSITILGKLYNYIYSS